MRNIADKSPRENQNTFMFNNVFFFSMKIVPVMSQYSRAEQATDDNMAHAHCMPDT
jgi:hypothetical protein